jgi:hypothetical protein
MLDDPDYINNLMVSGMDFVDPEVNQFFTSAEFLQVV